MESKSRDISLLDYLTEKIGCNYISDLSLPEQLPVIQKVLISVDASAFVLRQWIDAVNYITKEKLSFDSADKAKEYLMQLKK